MLFKMSRELDSGTSGVYKTIDKFIKHYKKFYGDGVFRYEGIDYLEAARREVIEINETIR